MDVSRLFAAKQTTCSAAISNRFPRFLTAFVPYHSIMKSIAIFISQLLALSSANPLLSRQDAHEWIPGGANDCNTHGTAYLSRTH